jgi:hypothetical protein
MNPDYIRAEIAKEQVVELDFGYLSGKTFEVFEAVKQLPFQAIKLHFISFFLQNIQPEHLEKIISIGQNYISGIQITNIFNRPIPEFGHAVHEALCDVIGLRDIKYSYEEHKVLFLKKDGVDIANWGHGYLEITPHQDDLYEDLNCDLLALTYVKDSTQTPTNLFLTKDILEGLSDSEIDELLNSSAIFKSGKNINGFKQKTRAIISQSQTNGIDISFDFRIDVNSGKRMTVQGEALELILEKVLQNIYNKISFQAKPATGTFVAVVNSKVLHARSKLQMTKEEAELIQDNFETIPRLLYRSKGQACRY